MKTTLFTLLTLLSTTVLSQQAPLIMSSDDHQPETGTDLLLSDVLPMERATNIFANLIRTDKSTDTLISDKSANLTILAPSNTALRDLPQKPWEDSRDYAAFGTEEAYKGNDGSERAQKNLRKFLEGHMVKNEGKEWTEGLKLKTVLGGEVWWKKEGDKRIIHPDGVEVSAPADEKATNGEVWVIKGVLGQNR